MFKYVIGTFLYLHNGIVVVVELLFTILVSASFRMYSENVIKLQLIFKICLFVCLNTLISVQFIKIFNALNSPF